MARVLMAGRPLQQPEPESPELLPCRTRREQVVPTADLAADRSRLRLRTGRAWGPATKFVEFVCLRPSSGAAVAQ